MKTSSSACKQKEKEESEYLGTNMTLGRSTFSNRNEEPKNAEVEASPDP